MNKPNQSHVELIEAMMRSEKMLTPLLNKPASDAIIDTFDNETFGPQPVNPCISKLWSGISDSKTLRPRGCDFGPHVAEPHCFPSRAW